MQILSANGEIILKQLLESRGTVSISKLQEYCNLSRKHVAYELQLIDDLLRENGARIHGTKGKGFEIKILFPEEFAGFSNDFLHDKQRNQYLHFSRNFLAYKILFDLVLNERFFSIDELTQMYFYSRGTISKSIKTVKTLLNKYGCTLISRPNYGMKFVGTEWNTRICLIYTDKIAFRMSSVIKDSTDEGFGKFIDKDRYQLRDIERIIQEVFNQYNLKIPYIYLTKLKLYVVISQTRADQYDLLDFNETQKSEILESPYAVPAEAIAERLNSLGYTIRRKDIDAITVFLLCFCSRISGGDYDRPETAEQCRNDTLDLIGYIRDLYFGVDNYLDNEFIREFSCFLLGLKARTVFQLPVDEESVYQVKQDGSFISDICRDFAVLYYRKYGIKLPEPEILSVYFIIHNSFSRYTQREANYRIILVSRYGIHFSRNVANRILEEYPSKIISIDVAEFTDVAYMDMQPYTFLLTDIEQDRYNFIELPIIRLDFFRFPGQSLSLNKYLSILLRSELQGLIKDGNVIKNRIFKTKLEVYGYLADHYISAGRREEFIRECSDNNTFLSDERGNRIALVSADSRFYGKKEIVLITGKTAFLWDNEPVQMIVFFNRKNRPYVEIKTLNSMLITFMHASAGLVEQISASNADEIIEFIVGSIYP
ncbi:BglG family transcription antiterminator [Breznakiella homolactica]|uniref:HTH domain-containing protein n=1 Tax=Breznakiella homolactica TaxID=2798577 RepID=A0A7T7XKZ3_9SPIR|nr:HTH domain-containing protein [Breznakiella homolactica]QQO08113.1 HTH domain-containing protein [Breznakiella homolactica]